jgi:hypothetical protein
VKSPALLLLLCGCSTFGDRVESFGNTIGRAGVVVMVGPSNTPFMPIGLAAGVPLLVFGAPFYYVGAMISGDCPNEYAEP